MKQKQPSGSTQRNAAAKPVKSKSNSMAWIRSRKLAIGMVAMFSVVAWAKPMGLLLWARLRILTSIPKTAIADDPANTPVVVLPPSDLETGLPNASVGLIHSASIRAHTPTPTTQRHPRQASSHRKRARRNQPKYLRWKYLRRRVTQRSGSDCSPPDGACPWQ